MTLSRRVLITGLVSLIAAPAIVRVASLMSVKVMEGDSELIRLMRALWEDAGRNTAHIVPRRWITYEEVAERWPDPADEAFFAGEQWTPQQIDGLKAARIS